MNAEEIPYIIVFNLIYTPFKSLRITRDLSQYRTVAEPRECRRVRNKLPDHKNRMISVAMLAHEDEDQLPATLEKAQKVADELIVVDSYSEDATAEIAADYDAEVYQTEWIRYADTW